MWDELGIFEPLIEAVPAEHRPMIVSVIGGLIVVVALYNLLKAVFELVRTVLRSFADGWSWFSGLFKPKRPIDENDIGPDPVPDERTIWETVPATPVTPMPLESGGIPIITIANMKGGVGKTTLTANLAASLQSRLSKPILVIDFDYQGSLSEMLWRHSGRSLSLPDMRAHSLLRGQLSPLQTLAHARTLTNGMDEVELYPARYPLATIENDLMIGWVQGNAPSDLRYRLSTLLRTSEFQSRYAMVLIDCPPRITTGTINALCASTHLLIPTKLDEMSAEAAVYFLQQIARMKDALFPALKVLGVVPTMTVESRRLADYEERGLARLEAVMASRPGWADLLLRDQRIPQVADIARPAGVGVAYLRRASTRPIFDRLATEVLNRLK